MHWIKAAFLYFLAVFGAGFVLGSIRVLLLVPRIGVRVAELIEMPLMVLLTIVAARWIVLRFGSPSLRQRPLRMGFLALFLMVAAEISLGSLAGATVPEYITARDPVSGPAYFAALVFFSLAPWLIVRRTWRHSTDPSL